MLKEFRDFAMRGNVLDMAIGVIIGGAFGKIISSSGQRRADASDRPTAGQSRFLESLPQPVRDATAFSCCCKNRRSPDAQLRGIFAKRVRLHHHSIRDLHVGQAGQPLQKRSDPAPPPPPAGPTNEEKLLMEIRDVLKGRH